MIRNHNFYNLNSTRRYPLDDGATGEDDNGYELRNDLLVDCRVTFPDSYGRYLYLAGITIADAVVTLVFAAADDPAVRPYPGPFGPPEVASVIDYVPVAGVTVTQPVDPYKVYELTPIMEGAAGWVVFGAGIKENYRGRFSTALQSMILPRCAIGARPISIPSLGKLANLSPLNGIVKLLGGTDFAIVKDVREIDGCDREALVFRLQASTTGQNVLDAYRGPCDVRPEAGTCYRPGIERVGPATPDCDGNIEIDFQHFLVGNVTAAQGAIVLDFDVGMAEVCRDNALPDANGRLQTEFTDQCATDILSSVSESSDDSFTSFSLSMESEIGSESIESILCRDLPILETFDYRHHSFTTVTGIFQFSKVDSPWESSSQIFSGWSSWSSMSSTLQSYDSVDGSLYSYDSSLVSCEWSSLSLRSSSSGRSDSSSEIYSSSSLSSSSSLDSSSEIHFSSSDCSYSSLRSSSSLSSYSEVLRTDSVSSSSSSSSMASWPPVQPSPPVSGRGLCAERDEANLLTLALPFWDGEGDTVGDQTSRAWHLTQTGLSWVTADYGGYAVEFNGTTDLLESSAETALLNDFSILALFKTTTHANQTLVCLHDAAASGAPLQHVSLELTSEGYLAVEWSPTGNVTYRIETEGDDFADGMWHLVIAERQGTSVVIRVDGYNVGGGTSETGGAWREISIGSAAWTIGGKGQGADPAIEHFTGQIGMVSVYDRVTTYAERSEWFENPWFLFYDCHPDQIAICYPVPFVDVRPAQVLVPVYRNIMLRRSKLVRQDAKWSLAAVDLSRRNVAILDDCGYEQTLNMRCRVDLMIPAPILSGAPANGGLIINHREVGSSYQHFYVVLDMATQSLSIRRFNGTSLLSPLPTTGAIAGLTVNEWYRLTVTTAPGSTSSEVLMTCELRGLADPSISATLTFATTNYLPATGKFGIGSERSVAHFSYFELSEA